MKILKVRFKEEQEFIDKDHENNSKEFDEGVSQKEFDDIVKHGKKIGLKTVGDFKRFLDNEAQDGESLYDALKRYSKELGDDFEIKEESVIDFKSEVVGKGFRVGDKLITKEGNEIEITDMYMSFGLYGDPDVRFKYDYKTTNGDTGSSECDYRSLYDMITRKKDESLNESFMSDLDIEVKESGGPAKYIAKIDKRIEVLKKELSDLEAKKEIVSKINKNDKDESLSDIKGTFVVELYKDRDEDPIRKYFNNYKDAKSFADDSINSNSDLDMIMINLRMGDNNPGGPSNVNAWDSKNGGWYKNESLKTESDNEDIKAKIKSDIDEESIEHLMNRFYGPEEGVKKSDVYGDFDYVSEVSEGTNDEGDNYIKVEVRAELDYDDMMDLSTKLDKILRDYDKNAYFDKEEPGIMSAYLFNVNKDKSLNDALKEDTIKKKNGKWVNRGDDGTEHGEFATKKQADAQRKAMFARGYKAN